MIVKSLIAKSNCETVRVLGLPLNPQSSARRCSLQPKQSSWMPMICSLFHMLSKHSRQTFISGEVKGSLLLLDGL